MRPGRKPESSVGLVFVLSALIGVGVVVYTKSRSYRRYQQQRELRTETPPESSHEPRSVIVSGATELRIVDSSGRLRIQAALNRDGAPGIWIHPSTEDGRGGTVQLGLHEDGLPFILVAGAGIRDFALGRVDGKNQTPIMVFRQDDEVRMLLGLDMTDPGRNPFFVHYGEGHKQEIFGSYCNDPGRVCTR
ncbi:MAG: hypothetical protein RIQ81_1145 [Pseudomonadota bacterium]|jgi:hypothetical protein